MRKVLIAGGVLILAVIVLAAVVPFLIPASAYEGKLIAAVKQATGRDLSIEGPVHIGILGGVSLEAHTVSLSNAPGAPDAAMLTLAKLDVGLKLIPLLSGDVEITRLILTSPIVHLNVDKSGTGNWTFEPAPARPAAGSDPAKTTKNAERLKQLHLGEVRIVDGTMTYADARTGKHQELTKLQASLKLASLDQPLDLSGSAVWRGQPVDLLLNVGKPQAAMEGAQTPVTLKLSAAPLKLDFQGDAASKPVLKADGTFAVSSPSLREAAAWAGSPLKAGGTGFGPMAVQGKLALAGKVAAVSGLSVSLDQIKGSGQMSADLSGKVPLIKGGLTLGDLDLNPYLGRAGAAVPSQASATSSGEASRAVSGPAPVAAPVTPGSGWSDAPIELAALRGLDAQLALDVTSFKFQKIEIGKSITAILLQGGRLNTAFKQMTLYGGSGSGEIAVDVSGAVTGLNATINLSHIQIQPVLEAVLGIDRLSGTGNMKLNIAAYGRSQHDLIVTLGGQGALSLADGAIKGVDFAALAKDIQAFSAKGTAAAAFGDTGFSTLGSTFTIASGVLANSDLSVTSPLFHLTGKGTASLLNRTLNYEIVPNLAGNLQGGKSGVFGTTIPILVQGPWTNLSYRPDLQAALGQKLNAKLPKLEAKLLGKAGKSAGGSTKPADVLKSFFGK